MGIFINRTLILCALYLCVGLSSLVNASRRPWTAENKSLARRTRAVQRPTSINCRLGRWSSWTPCTACTDKQFRFRYLERPSQFGGSMCFDSLWEKLACPTATTQCMVPDYCGESFTCSQSGRCISQSLRCNGETDCEDFSDEDNCESVYQRDDKCSKLMLIPGANSGVQGYNALTTEFVDPVLDPAYFGGQCEYVYNGEWRKFTYEAFCESLQYRDDEKNYRKPYNYHTYQFMAEATSEGSHEYYDDVVDLLNARKESSSSKGGVSVGIYHVEAGLKASRENEFYHNITQHSNQNLGFVRLWSKVQTARFKMRTDKLMLNEDFYVSLMDLPEEYDFGMYSSFINTFGTHYITEGTMGGTLEYVLVLNKTSMANSKLEGEEAGQCFGASIGLSFPITQGVEGDLKANVKDCQKDSAFSKVSRGSSGLVEDIHTLVKGGVLVSSTGVAAIRNPDTYRRWGASLKYNPTLIEYETMPIYELVRFSTVAGHVGSRQANLQRAWDEYLQQFDPCRCAPCRHNGIPFLTGTSCQCLCKEGYRGDACEETLRSDTRTDGSWSCWGAWSSCLSGRKTRSRSCNNPAPDGGGATCLGSSSQTLYC